MILSALYRTHDSKDLTHSALFYKLSLNFSYHIIEIHFDFYKLAAVSKLNIFELLFS